MAVIAFACCFAYVAVGFVVGMWLVVAEYRAAAREDDEPRYVGHAIFLGVVWPSVPVLWAVYRLGDFAKFLARVDELPEVRERREKALERELGIGQPETRSEAARRMYPHIVGQIVNIVEDDGSTHVETLP